MSWLADNRKRVFMIYPTGCYSNVGLWKLQQLDSLKCFIYLVEIQRVNKRQMDRNKTNSCFLIGPPIRYFSSSMLRIVNIFRKAEVKWSNQRVSRWRYMKTNMKENEDIWRLMKIFEIFWIGLNVTRKWYYSQHANVTETE